jgi:hypothetical protein
VSFSIGSLLVLNSDTDECDEDGHKDGHLDQRAGLLRSQQHRHAARPQRGDGVDKDSEAEHTDEVDSIAVMPSRSPWGAPQRVAASR